MKTNGTVPASEQPPGLRAQEGSLGLALPEIVGKLREILGVRLVAYIGNVKSTQPVASWASGQRSPGGTDADRPRYACQIAALLRERYSTTTVQSWFKGMNPALRDTAPARILREGDPVEVGPDVLAAARSFMVAWEALNEIDDPDNLCANDHETPAAASGYDWLEGRRFGHATQTGRYCYHSLAHRRGRQQAGQFAAHGIPFRSADTALLKKAEDRVLTRSIALDLRSAQRRTKGTR